MPSILPAGTIERLVREAEQTTHQYSLRLALEVAFQAHRDREAELQTEVALLKRDVAQLADRVMSLLRGLKVAPPPPAPWYRRARPQR